MRGNRQSQESVDEYAQDLRTLFFKAYSQAQQGSREAEQMGQSVLAYQFVAGLCPEIKKKVAGAEGDFNQLLTRARFEEAKLRDLADSSQKSDPKKSVPTPQSTPTPVPARTGNPNRTSSSRFNPCFKCGSPGHIAKYCRKKGRAAPVETPGKNSRVASITPSGATAPSDLAAKHERIVQLREELKAAEADEALSKVTATMHSIIPTAENTSAELGPVLTTKLSLEGSPVNALLDTGSPVTIVSLEFLLQALAKQRKPEQSPSSWKAEVERRWEESSIPLQSYGGERLNNVKQMKVTISRGDTTVNTIVQIHNDAPVPLLIGTDVQPLLGFAFLQPEHGDQAIDLLQKKKVCVKTVGDMDSEVDDNSNGVDSDGTATVRLISATRVPGRHARLIKARIDGPVEKSLTLFESEETLAKSGVTVPDAAVEPTEDGLVTLIVENHGMESVHLDDGVILGRMEPANLSVTSEAEPPRVNTLQSVQPVPCVEWDMSVVESGKSVSAIPRRRRLLDMLKLKNSALSREELKQLESLILSFDDVFAVDSSELGSTDVISHSINTGDSLPIRQPARRTPFALRETVAQMVQEMLKSGIIEPSKSPWASPVVLVAKKDGSTRFCVDYRRLNSVTKQDVFPLPRIDDSLDLLSQSKFFTTLDLSSGYWQVRMDPESKEKTAFVTHSGLYEFSVMPFGLTNAPSTFQRLMETVLSGLVRKCCVVYLDDILVTGETFQEHLENLRQIFDRLKQAKLRLKPSKCQFLRQEVEYLGYIVSKDGVAADPAKVKAVQNFPVPADLKSLRSFLGLASYYRRFIPQFSVVANPLFSLTRKNAPFDWSVACQEAFDRLKQLLTQAPILAFPDFSQDFLLETDASGHGLGAVLSQRQGDGTVKPIAYASRTLQNHEKNYGITELEGLGVVWAVKHFRHYLYGHHCDVYTDHEALKALLNTPHPSGKLARWGLILQELDLSINYRPGRKNEKADALSRSPSEREPVDEHCSLGVVATLEPVDPEKEAKSGDDHLSERQRSDPSLAVIFEYLETNSLPEDEKQARELVLSKSQYQIVEGVLYRIEADKTLRVIPPEEEREKLFHTVHDGAFGGHLRASKIHSQLSRHYWWAGMRSDISKWC